MKELMKSGLYFVEKALMHLRCEDTIRSMLNPALRASLPKEVARYISMVELQCRNEQARAQRQEERAKRAELEVDHLRILLRLERIQKYGPGSERLSDAQLELLDLEPGVAPREIQLEADLPEPEKKRTPRTTHRGLSTLPVELPREEVVIACHQDDCTCPQCQGEREVIGYETAQRLHRIPARYVVRVFKREKRACSKCPQAGVTTASQPAHIIEKGIGTNELVVDVLINKYEMHLPLYRQEVQIERESAAGLSRQTMSDWVMQCGFLLQAPVDHMRSELLRGNYIQADETPIGVQAPEKKGANHRGFLWEYSRPGACVIFDYRDGRGREGPRQFLGSYSGILQTDGYTAYDDEVGGPGMVRAACMAHVRRKFHDAHKVDPSFAALNEILNVTAALYKIESDCRAEGVNPQGRLQARQKHSVPLMRKLRGLVIDLKKQALPRSLAGRACDYALSQWTRLEVFLSNGLVEIDNNWAENAIRPVVVGRKNWLHFGSKEAGPNIAAILSIFETCHRLGINVREYLLDVLPKLANGSNRDVPALTPSAWLAAKN
jgi:transposase